MPDAARNLFTYPQFDAAPYSTPLHADTSPAAIASDQRDALSAELPLVLAAWRSVRRYPTVPQLIDCLSHATDLPRWTVERRLVELGVIAKPKPVQTRAVASKAGDERFKIVVAWLKKHKRYATSREIADGTGLSRKQVRSIVGWERKQFRRDSTGSISAKTHNFVYQLKDFEKEPVPA